VPSIREQHQASEDDVVTPNGISQLKVVVLYAEPRWICSIAKLCPDRARHETFGSAIDYENLIARAFHFAAARCNSLQQDKAGKCMSHRRADDRPRSNIIEGITSAARDFDCAVASMREFVDSFYRTEINQATAVREELARLLELFELPSHLREPDID
jgi:hypothetical protein